MIVSITILIILLFIAVLYCLPKTMQYEDVKRLLKYYEKRVGELVDEKSENTNKFNKKLHELADRIFETELKNYLTNEYWIKEGIRLARSEAFQVGEKTGYELENVSTEYQNEPENLASKYLNYLEERNQFCDSYGED